MNVKRINNTSEIITYNELLQGLSDADYLIFAKLPIRDVIDSEVTNQLRKKEKNLFSSSHFDFVVTDKHHIPLFAVEFDGPHHLTYEDTIKRDIRKNKICQISKLPLIRVTDVEIEKYDSISILQFMAYRFVNWQKEHLRIKNDINSKILEMSQDELKSVTKGIILDPSIDPEFQFDIEFPFPLKWQVEEEILKYNLTPFSLNEEDKNALWYSVLPVGESSIDGVYIANSSYGVYEGNSSTGGYSWSNGKIENQDIKILLEGDIKFGLKWALVTDEYYNPNESPDKFSKREGRYPIYFSEIPGADIPSISKAIVEYLCYKKVLEWAIQSGKVNS